MVRLTDAQIRLLAVFARAEGWLRPLEVMNALRGPLRDPTLNKLLATSLVEERQTKTGPEWRATEAGRVWAIVNGRE